MTLDTLQDATNEAIELAKKEPRHIFEGCGGINWGDLRCVEAEHYINTNTDGYRVYIEEVDPINEIFKDYISKKLEKQGYEDIEIITEW